MEDCENRFNSTFGFPSEKAVAKVKDVLSEPIKQFISESPFMVMATSNHEGKCDASPKGGKPGFVRVLDDRICWYRTSRETSCSSHIRTWTATPRLA